MNDLYDSVSRSGGGAEPERVEQLLESHLPRVRAFVRLRMDPGMRAREASCDLVQSVCRELLQQQDRFELRDEVAFRAWLFTTALNKIRDRHRYWHRQRRDIAREEAPAASVDGDALYEEYGTLMTPSMQAIAHEEAERLEACFDELPDDYREVVTLARVVGLPHAEIAEQMGRSVGAVRMLLGRALRELASKLGDA